LSITQLVMDTLASMGSQEECNPKQQVGGCEREVGQSEEWVHLRQQE